MFWGEQQPVATIVATGCNFLGNPHYRVHPMRLGQFHLSNPAPSA
jgi:hypothetical protein